MPVTLTLEQRCKVPRCNVVRRVWPPPACLSTLKIMWAGVLMPIRRRRCVLAFGTSYAQVQGVSSCSRLLLWYVKTPLTRTHTPAFFGGLCKQEHIWTMQRKKKKTFQSLVTPIQTSPVSYSIWLLVFQKSVSLLHIPVFR